MQKLSAGKFHGCPRDCADVPLAGYPNLRRREKCPVSRLKLADPSFTVIELIAAVRHRSALLLAADKSAVLVEAR